MQSAHRVLASVVAVAVVAGTLLLGPTPALAYANCDPQRSAQAGFWHAGSNDTIHTATSGIYTVKFESDAWVDINHGSEQTSAWVMLAGAGANQVAQDGTLYGSLGYRKEFDQEWLSSTNIALHVRNPFSLETNHTYEVIREWVSGFWKYEFIEDGSTAMTAYANFTPNQTEVFGELHNKKNQMPGTASTREIFSASTERSGYYYNGTASWSYFYGNSYGNTDSNISWFGYYGNGTTKIYDKGCA